MTDLLPHNSAYQPMSIKINLLPSLVCYHVSGKQYLLISALPLTEVIMFGCAKYTKALNLSAGKDHWSGSSWGQKQ